MAKPKSLNNLVSDWPIIDFMTNVQQDKVLQYWFVFTGFLGIYWNYRNFYESLLLILIPETKVYQLQKTLSPAMAVLTSVQGQLLKFLRKAVKFEKDNGK